MTPGTPGAENERTALRLVDTHAHLQAPQFEHGALAEMGRAQAAGVGQVIVVGTTADDSEEAVALARTHVGAFAAVGIQPNTAAAAVESDWERVAALIDQPEVVALGETGLDRYWQDTPFEVQQAWFDRHLDLAHRRGLPVVIHCRDCEADIIAQLERLGRPVRGVLHSFSGAWEHAQAFLDLGLHLSFSGMVTFKNKKLDALRAVAARMPLDRLLVETDSPYLAPHPLRGAVNEPAHVVLTAQRIAELRGLSFADLARATTANACQLFALPPTEAPRPPSYLA